MKITMYELSGMVKDGKAPKKIKYENCEYYLYDDKTYISTDKTRYFDNIYFTELNAEVEILKEPKGIPEKLEILPNNEQYSNKVLYGKINEIIDTLEMLNDKIK